MQNSDGGWGAFDRDNDRAFLNHIPFADHNAMLDPSSPDCDGPRSRMPRAIRLDASHPRVRKAIQYLLKEQTPEGAWYGRWGVNYVYGTSGVLRALAAVGCRRPATRWHKRSNWLRSVQHEDGGFGESCATYDDPSLMGKGRALRRRRPGAYWDC